MKATRKAVSKTLTDKNILNVVKDIFDSDTDLDINKIFLKYSLLKEESLHFIDALESIVNIMQPAYPDMIIEANNLKAYITEMHHMVATAYYITDKNNPNFIKTYKELRDSELIGIIIGSCLELTKVKHFISDPEALNDVFLRASSGLSFSPLNKFEAFNIKLIYASLVIEDGPKLMKTLYQLFISSNKVYEQITQPDVDIDKIILIVREAIGELKKHIPRCDKAFNMIIESVELLKDNFGDYYRNFLSSGNHGIIIENFIVDVAQSSKQNLQIYSQFSRIIRFYQKMQSQQKINDPRITGMQDQLTSLCKHIEKIKSSKPVEEEKVPEEKMNDEQIAAEWNDSFRIAPATGKRKKSKHVKKHARKHAVSAPME